MASRSKETLLRRERWLKYFSSNSFPTDSQINLYSRKRNQMRDHKEDVLLKKAGRKEWVMLPLLLLQAV